MHLLKTVLFVKRLVHTLNINQIEQNLKSIAQTLFSFSLCIKFLDTLAEFVCGGGEQGIERPCMVCWWLLVASWNLSLQACPPAHFHEHHNGLGSRTSRYRMCRAQIQGDLVESYGFLTNQLILSKLSTNVHYSKKEVWLSDILTYTYQFLKIYLEN